MKFDKRWHKAFYEICKKHKFAAAFALTTAVAAPLTMVAFSETAPRIPFSEFLAHVNNDNIQNIVITDDQISGALKKDGGEFVTLLPPQSSAIIEKLAEKDFRMEAKSSFEWKPYLPLIFFLPITFFMFLTFRQMQIPANRGHKATKGEVKFADIAGIDEAKAELQEVVEFLQHGDRFKKLGAKTPKGILLIGPSGTGKTLLAKAVSGEAGVPFFSYSGSDFVEMFVGVGAARIRAMFKQAKKKTPSIIFIDEIDALARARENFRSRASNSERDQTLNQLLVAMDGIGTDANVILIAATNRPDMLDQAVMRPGRFDRHIYVGLPDIVGREQILGVHVQKIVLGQDIDLRVIAAGTPGFSGADLANLVNEAAIMAARRNLEAVGMPEFDAAKDKVTMGLERKILLGDQEKKTTAYHEAGHALVGMHMPQSDPLQKITIIPHGGALGATVLIPERDRNIASQEKFESDLAILMAGRIAEEIIFGKSQITNGASNDIKRANELARKMVAEYGMSGLGCIYSGPEDQNMPLSPANAAKIDNEIRKIIGAAQDRARSILETHRGDLEIIANALLERETLTGDEVNQLIGKQPHVAILVNLQPQMRATPA